MSEWGRLQDTLHDEFDRQGVTGVDVDKVIECIVNVRDFFPGLLAGCEAAASVPAPEQEEAVRLREALLDLMQHHRHHYVQNPLRPSPCDKAQYAADAALATPPPAASVPAPEEEAVRELLWRMHGHDFIYGDDGEMQCNWSHDHADFKRDTMEHLVRHCNLALMEHAALATLPPVPAAPPTNPSDVSSRLREV